ncbi:MICAL-like protein 1 isoform X1 [Planococcus citri]|uniref:MICAL-like protein 1 isoform X1 n=1 Tax=Planococcus citri TaxID=170843 RepID=UPI0031F78FBF
MDQLSDNETGANNRKSLVISRRELFEQINSTDRNNARNDIKTTTANRPKAVGKPVSRSNSEDSDIDGDDISKSAESGRDPRVNNCVNSDNVISDGGIDVNADDVKVNANRSPVTKKQEVSKKEYLKNGDLSPDFKCLQIGDDLSPCSKRISYNMAVSGGEFGKIAIRSRLKDKSRPDDNCIIDESDSEEAAVPSVVAAEIPLERNAAAVTDTIDESDSDENDVKVEKIDADVVDKNEHTGSSDSMTISATEDSPVDDFLHRVPVDDINIEDLNSTKLTNDILSVISSSRIIDECKFDETDNTTSAATRNNTSSPDNATPVKSDDIDYPEELNPFGDDDETKDNVSSSKDTKTSNPFDSEDSETDSSKDKSSSVKVNTNPFWSGSEDEDEPSVDEVAVKKTPVPLPRSVRKPIVNITPQPSPKPRTKSPNFINECGSPSIANLTPSPSPSRRSIQTIGGGVRKLSGDSLDVSFQRSPGSQSVNSTLRKKKPAPPPPTVAAAKSPNSNNNISTNEAQLEEQANETNVSLTTDQQSVRPKTGVSPWKNKKGPAPARPIPLRRPVKEMPIEDIKIELSDIEVRQQELERQGKQLEQMIHDQNTSNSDNAEESSSNEELVLQLFELVNEKNELLRRHSELMYMRKMHNLEEEHADIEYQLRCLMLQPESNKTDCDKTREEELLRRLLEVVEKRNEIIEAMEKDRLRETAEDKSVTTQLDVNECHKEEKSASRKTKKKKDKLKEHKEGGEKSHDNKHSPSKVIKQKFMTLRHSTKKLNSKIPH